MEKESLAFAEREGERLPLPSAALVERSGPRSGRKAFAAGARFLLLWLCYLAFLELQAWFSGADTLVGALGLIRGPSRVDDGVQWKSCGEGIELLQCANVSVPLDYHNTSDPRTVTIALTRLPASDKENRQGAIFINPGGPGGSGTSYVYRAGKRFETIVKGQFDILGFDPRGINLTRPYVSCFESELQEQAYQVSTHSGSLNLPANVSSFMPGVLHDLERQVTLNRAATTSLAHKCRERTGDALAYMGTEAVVRDIDYLSRLIEGEDKPVNFWGISYGTIIGQYLIKILPPNRVGRVIIDAVVNPTVWAETSKMAHTEGLDNVDDVLSSFATSCFNAGTNCTLNALAPNKVFNFTSPKALLNAIDTTLDALYTSPVPIFDLPTPAVANADNLRAVLFRSMYKIDSWPALAEHLAAAFTGNFTGIVNATMAKVDPASAHKPDSSSSSTMAIFCDDTKPYSKEDPPPSDAELAELVLESVAKYSSRMGDRFFDLSLCHAWDEAGLTLRKSRYAGPFDMADGTLDTPMLVLSNTYDPVTSLASAKYANERLGDNARLIQQKDGWGHGTPSHVSFCTVRAVRAYMVRGELPEDKHTICAVDQKPFQPWNGDVVGQNLLDDEYELVQAWAGLADDWMPERM